MRTITCFFLLFLNILPIAMPAQPVVTMNEYYGPGDVITMVACEPSGLNAGASGAGLHWNFAGMSPLGGYYNTTVQNDTSTVFLTSNLLFSLPGRKYMHVRLNSTDTYIYGIYDEPAGITTHYDNFNIARRPFTYGTSYVDTYRATIPPAEMHGTGVLTVTGDAYGTLVLPNGTYNNVLRIKKLAMEIDTSVTAGIVSTVNVSYLWFDSLHAAPLMQLDSTISIMGNVQRAMYLASPVGISGPSIPQSAYTAYLKDNELLLQDDFEAGKVYEVVLCNMIGTRIIDQDFVATGNTQRIDISKAISPGIYIVSLRVKGEPGTQQIVKVVKQ